MLMCWVDESLGYTLQISCSFEKSFILDYYTTLTHRTYDHWNASPVFCYQLSYIVRSVQVCDILQGTNYATKTAW